MALLGLLLAALAATTATALRTRLEKRRLRAESTQLQAAIAALEAETAAAIRPSDLRLTHPGPGEPLEFFAQIHAGNHNDDRAEASATPFTRIPPSPSTSTPSPTSTASSPSAPTSPPPSLRPPDAPASNADVRAARLTRPTSPAGNFG